MHHRRGVKAGGWAIAVLALAISGIALAATQAGAVDGRLGLTQAGADRPAAALPAERSDEKRYTYDPAFKSESHPIGMAQQFEVRLRPVLPGNPHGYSVGIRQALDAKYSMPGNFNRYSVRLPGLANHPRPYLELSVVAPDR